MTKLTFIGAGSTIFMRNIVGDMLHFEALRDAEIALMDIDPDRLAESEQLARRMIATMGTGATVATHTDQRRALEGADFVVTAFQIGGYDPCTITDFEIPKAYGLRQTIADTLGVGGIMRGLRTVPHLWKVAEDMAAVCPDALLMQYVNPSLQFLLAVLFFGQAITVYHAIALPMIWVGLTIYSVSSVLTARRRASAPE